MSEQIIRDVLIRVNLENGSTNLNFPETSQIKEATDNYERFMKSHSDGTRASSSPGPSTESAFAEVNKLRESIIQDREGASRGEAKTKLQMMQEEVAQLTKVKEATTELAQSVSSVVAAEETANASTVLWTGSLGGLAIGVGVATAAVATLAIGTSALGTVLRELRDTNRAYWDDIAEDAEHSAVRVARSMTLQGQHGLASINANMDTSHVALSPKRAALAENRETQIRQEQALIGHGPLAQRMEIRQRIESQGRRDDTREGLRESRKHLEEKLNDLDIAEFDLRSRFPQLDDAAENMKTQRDAAADQKRATFAGSVIEKSLNPNRLLGAAASAIDPSGGILSSMIPEMGILNPNTTLNQGTADFFGQTTTHQAEKLQAENRLAGAEGNRELTEAEKGAQNQLAQIMKEKEKTQIELNSQQEKGLELTREQVREFRMAAEVGQEELLLRQRAFGAATPGEQSRLRQIQAKADRVKAGGNETFTPQEMRLAEQFKIDAVSQIHAQQEAVANRVENAGLFAEQGKMQEGRADRARDAEKAAIKEDQELVAAIRETAKDAEAQNQKVIDEVKRLNQLGEFLEAIQVEMHELNKRIDSIKAKDRRWFG